MTIPLPTLNDAEAVERARAAFAERQSATVLAEPDAELETGPDARAVDLRAFLAGDRGAAGSVVPFGLIALQRRRLRAHARGHSAVARAASTIEDVAREVGPFRLELIEESDAAFVLVRPRDGNGEGDGPLPSRLDLINEPSGLSLGFDLPEPVGGVVQLGLPLGTPDGRLALEALRDPRTELFLL